MKPISFIILFYHVDEYFSMEEYPQNIIKSIIEDNGSKFSTLGEYLSTVVDVICTLIFSVWEGS